MNCLQPDMHEILSQEFIGLLNSRQIFSVCDFISADPHQISRITGLSFRDVLAVRKSLLNKYSALERNGYDYYKTLLKNSAIISTGIPNLDLLLDGGFFTGNIYELCGSPAAGKTQFCLNLVKHISHNLKQNVYYFCTKGDFSANRVKNLVGTENEDELMASLSRILVKQLQTKYDLYSSLVEIKDIASKSDSTHVRIIVIDSLTALFLECSDQSDINGSLNYIVNTMRYIVTELHMALVITNLITTWNEGDFRNMGQTKETISLGKYWYNIPNVRLKFEMTDPESSVCRISLLRSGITARVSNSSVLTTITERGFDEKKE